MKNERKFIGIIFALLVVALVSACTPLSQKSTQSGRAVFVLADAAADMGNVTSVKITVESVRVLNDSGEWTTVSTKQQTYDLLELKAKKTQVLLADYNLTPGVYRQVRLDVSKVIVTDASGDHVAKLPSGELKIIGKLVINENSTSTVRFDFIADESLHMTGNGTYIFAPVIQFETRQRCNVDTHFRNDVRIHDGNIDGDMKHGMGLDGNFREGMGIRRDARLFIHGDKITENN